MCPALLQTRRDKHLELRLIKQKQKETCLQSNGIQYVWGARTDLVGDQLHDTPASELNDCPVIYYIAYSEILLVNVKTYFIWFIWLLCYSGRKKKLPGSPVSRHAAFA